MNMIRALEKKMNILLTKILSTLFSKITGAYFGCYFVHEIRWLIQEVMWHNTGMGVVACSWLVYVLKNILGNFFFFFFKVLEK